MPGQEQATPTSWSAATAARPGASWPRDWAPRPSGTWHSVPRARSTPVPTVPASGGSPHRPILVPAALAAVPPGAPEGFWLLRSCEELDALASVQDGNPGCAIISLVAGDDG